MPKLQRRKPMQCRPIRTYSFRFVTHPHQVLATIQAPTKSEARAEFKKRQDVPPLTGAIFVIEEELNEEMESLRDAPGGTPQSQAASSVYCNPSQEK